MERRAGTALSSRVVRVGSQDRPADVLEKIEQCRATHVVVVEGGQCLSVMSAQEARRTAPQSPNCDWLTGAPPPAISRNLSLDDAARRLAESDVDALPVVDEHGTHVGLVTRQSLLAAMVDEKQALAASEALLRSVLDQVPAIIVQIDKDSRLTYVNRTVPGMAVEDVVGRHITALIPPEFQSRLLAHLQQVAQDRQPVRFEFPGRGPQGTTMLYAGRIAPLEHDGNFSGFISVVTDATEGRKIEQALRESEQRLREILNNAPVVLFALDRHGAFTVAEGKGRHTRAVPPEDLVGRSAAEYYRDNPQMLALLTRAMAGEEFNSIVEYAGRAYNCHVAPLHDSNGEIAEVIGVATDITEGRQAERQARRLLDELARTGRISTMGEMASGLAHELNQPLAAIVAYVDACQELVESGRMDQEQLSEVLRSVSSQAERAGQIIHRLRKMIRRSQPVRAVVSVNDAVREVAELFENEARQSGVTTDVVLAHGLPAIAADFLQVQQVVLNLMRNGVEAMKDVLPDERRLTVTTGRTPAGDIEIAVSDFGQGLTGASADRLFEPFFTTKANGMGLGLSISRTIVDAHGGRIWITSNVPRGVTARFTLPLSSGKMAHELEPDGFHR